jgi:C_GCAxxG_C_C family probable redox protein
VNNFGIEDLATFKAATGLSGGIASTCQGACGALTAGVLAIGLVYGREKLEKTGESAAFQETKKRAGTLCDRFTEEFGSIRCNEVQIKVYGKSWNLRDKRGKDDFEATRLANGRNMCADAYI